MAGKGSKPRPLSIPRKQFDDNWDRIFGKKKDSKIEINKKQLRGRLEVKSPDS